MTMFEKRLPDVRVLSAREHPAEEERRWVDYDRISPGVCNSHCKVRIQRGIGLRRVAPWVIRPGGDGDHRVVREPGRVCDFLGDVKRALVVTCAGRWHTECAALVSAAGDSQCAWLMQRAPSCFCGQH